MLLNLSNHPAAKWSAAQIQAAQKEFGDLHDLPFPAIAPDADLHAIIARAHEYVQKCQALIQQQATNYQHPATSSQQRTPFISWAK